MTFEVEDDSDDGENEDNLDDDDRQLVDRILQSDGQTSDSQQTVCHKQTQDKT